MNSSELLRRVSSSGADQVRPDQHVKKEFSIRIGQIRRLLFRLLVFGGFAWASTTSLAACSGMDDLTDIGKLEPVANALQTASANESQPDVSKPTSNAPMAETTRVVGGGPDEVLTRFPATRTPDALDTYELAIYLQMLNQRLCAIYEGNLAHEGQQILIPRADDPASLARTALSIMNTQGKLQACFDGQGESDLLQGVGQVRLGFGFDVYDPETGLVLHCRNIKDNINRQTCEPASATPTPTPGQ